MSYSGCGKQETLTSLLAYVKTSLIMKVDNKETAVGELRKVLGGKNIFCSFHSIMVEMQHWPREIISSISSWFRVCKEFAIMCSIFHVKL